MDKKIGIVLTLFGLDVILHNVNCSSLSSVGGITTTRIHDTGCIMGNSFPFEALWLCVELTNPTFIFVLDATTNQNFCDVSVLIQNACLMNFSTSSFYYERNWNIFEDFTKEILLQSSEVFILPLLTLETIEEIWEKVMEEHLSDQKLKWLVLSTEENVSFIANKIPNGHEVRYFGKSLHGGFTYSRLRKFNTGNKDQIQIDKIAVLSSKANESTKLTKCPLMNNLNDKILKVAVVNNWPFFGLSTAVDGNIKPTSGIDVSVLMTLTEALNFSFQILSPADGQWGIPLPDGNISGMIGMVAREEADCAIDEITISDTRDQVVDFTTQYYMESSVILSKAPQQASKFAIVFSPFSREIWFILLLCVFAYSGLLWITQTYFSFYGETETKLSFQRCLMKTLQSLTFQGIHLKVKSWTLRFLLIGWFFFGLLMYAIYAGSLIALFAAPGYDKPIDSLEDLLTNKDVTPVVTDGSSIHQLLQMATSGIYKHIYDKLRPGLSFASSIDEGVDKVLHGRFVLVEAKLASEIRATILNRKEFYVSRQTFYPQSYGVACRKGSYLVPMFNKYLPRFVDMGLIEIWKVGELTKVTDIGQKKEEKAEKKYTLTTSHLQGAFILFLVGNVTATITVLIEIFFRYKLQRSLTQLINYPNP